jgi:uncharacterized protein (TIGR02145 family)
MKRITVLYLLSLLLFSLSCEDEKQIVYNPNDKVIITDRGDTIRIDSLFISQTGQTDARIELMISLPDSIDKIECGIEISTDSTFKEGSIQKVKAKEPIMGNNQVSVLIENLRPNEKYYYRVYYTYKNIVKNGMIQSFRTLPLECSYVDLGLSVYWASCNIGANAPEEYGDYYAWGETNTKEVCTWSTYQWKKENSSLLTKYCPLEEYGIVDGKTLLDIDDDVVKSLYGNDWQLPSKEEWIELENNCDWKWTAINNTTGWLITSMIEGYEDRSIFLPASGVLKDNKLINAGSFASYWSNQLNGERPRTAYALRIDSLEHSTTVYDRCYGLSVRPVRFSKEWFDNTVITLNYEQRTVFPSYSFSLTPTVLYKDSVIYGSGIWSSDNPTVAIVGENGVVMALSEGTANIYYSINDIQAKCTINVLASETNIDHNYVDLGLSVNWATFNVGAITPEDFGDLYAWGELEKKDSYTQPNYKYRDGYIDGLRTLSLDDDVAHVKWGGSWRMPSFAELEELKYNCSWTQTTINGVSGYIVTSKIAGYTDRSIFIPETRPKENNTYGFNSIYWSSTIETDISSYEYKDLAKGIYLNNLGRFRRDIGCSVRPVSPSDSWLSTISISFDSDSAFLLPGYRLSLKASVNKGNDVITLNDMIKWTSSNPHVADVEYQEGSSNTIKALAPGYTTITASIQSQIAQYTIKVYAESEIEHEYVDLGLSVNWATFNVGSLDPYDIGQKYAWGEIETKDRYYAYDYKWYDYVRYSDGRYFFNIQKYNYISEEGVVDNLTELELCDDVANIKWGEGWRMPTKEEFEELLNNCSGSKKDGCIVLTSKIDGFTDRSIVLPVLNNTLSYDQATYWSSSLYQITLGNYYYSYDPISLDKAFCLNLSPNNGSEHYRCNINMASRSEGLSVRPVIESKNWISQLSLTISEQFVTIHPNISPRYCLTASAMNNGIDVSERVKWTTDDPNIAVVDEIGVVTGLSTGTTIITASMCGVERKCTVTVAEPQIVKEYVDLGLSVKWATCNIGAEKPEESGNYYAWGELGTKDVYSSYNYKYNKMVYNTNNKQHTTSITKYNNNTSLGFNGFVDYKMTLDAEDDIAHIMWGDNWRMPTYAEIKELVDSCIWTWTSINGKKGYIISGKKAGYEDKSIFLPSASDGVQGEIYTLSEFGYYWSNSLQSTNASYSSCICFNTNSWGDPWHGIGSISRYQGCAIRPVFP